MTKLFFIVLLAALALVNSSPVTSEQQVDQSVDLLARDSEVDAAKSPMAKRCHAACKAFRGREYTTCYKACSDTYGKGIGRRPSAD